MKQRTRCLGVLLVAALGVLSPLPLLPLTAPIAPTARNAPIDPIGPAAPAQPAAGSQALAPVAPLAGREGHATNWKEVERLIAEEKLEEAARLVDGLLAEARRRGDEEEWTRALVERLRLRIALGGYETAVHLLKDDPWPQGTLHRTVLDLFYAHALGAYYRRFSWEINQREQVVAAPGGVDLKLWTRDQIHGAAIAAYLDAWRGRQALGGEPLSRFAAYLNPNNYPHEVRGTLRDALSYLFAELLADTSLWSPRELNEVYRLDLGRLIAGEPERSEAALEDAGAHPLARMAAVLGDLETWHLAAGTPGRAAALEARLERLSRLHAALREPGERERRGLLVADLSARLPAYRDISWWSRGMAILAGFVRDADRPEDGLAEPTLARAREIARQGYDAYPKSPGGALCLDIARTIEAPAIQLRAMSTDGPRRRSLEVEHKNLPALHFRAYPVDLVRRLTEPGPRGAVSPPFPQGQEVLRLLASGAAPAAEWRTELPGTPDFERHKTYVTPPLATPGAYLLVASPRGDFAAQGNPLVATGFIVSDLVLLGRALAGAEHGLEVRALSGATGRPLDGVELAVYRHDWSSGPRLESTRTTSGDGAARFAPEDDPRAGWVQRFALGRHGAELAVLELPVVSQPGSPKEELRSLFYTDRSIYRSGQKVLWKVLVYRLSTVDSEPRAAATAQPVTVTLVDPNGQEVATQSVATNDFGTASGEVVLPSGRPLGDWTLRSSAGGQASLRVEEYKRPTFEVKLDVPALAPRLNREASFKGEARYYFGLPVASGHVAWRATREPVYAGWWGRGGGRATGSQVVAAGASDLAADGTFRVSFTPAGDERGLAAGGGLTYRYRISVEVTDEGGETREAERAFRLGKVAVEATLSPSAGFLREGEAGTVEILRRDLDGEPRPGEGSWRLFELRQPERALLPAELPDLPPPSHAAEEAAGGGPSPYRTPGDGMRPRWAELAPQEAEMAAWAEQRELASGVVRHDARGRAEVALPALAAGAYRLRYETADAFGGRFEAARELIVAGGRSGAPALPLILLAREETVHAGGTARLFAGSGLAGQPLRFEIFRAGALVSQRSLVAGRDATLIELPVGREDRGGFALRLWTVSDHQLLVRTAEIFVPWDDRALEVSFSSFRDTIRPGARETWKVTVRSRVPGAPDSGAKHPGAPGPAAAQAAPGADRAASASAAAAAEILASMYDRSLDLFAPHPFYSLVDLFPRRTGLPRQVSCLGSAAAILVTRPEEPRSRQTPRFRADSLKLVEQGLLQDEARSLPARASALAGGVAEPMMSFGQPVAPAPAGSPAFKKALAGTAGSLPASPPPPPLLPEPAQESGGQLRSDFSETAFWQPHLLTGPDGEASIEFTVPDSVTSWSVWVEAVTRDLRTGGARKEARSVKELLVRPYLPRFLRQGDSAEVKVVVNNASPAELAGRLVLEIYDPETNRSLLSEFGLDEKAASRPFKVAAGGGAALSYPIRAPRRLGPAAWKVTATADHTSDGELRLLPVLPARIELAQSRFAALHDRDRRVLEFPDLRRDDDPTRVNEQLVVTLDAQLFYSVLSALPYLESYPYECTEQTLNRFLSSAIVARVFARYPAVAKMAQELAARRDTPLESWNAADPNRMMALEETPWLAEAAGGERGRPDPALLKVLDPRVAQAERDSALARLAKAQLADGSFPWWPGGPPSPFMTLYLLAGLARAAEAEVPVPREMVQRGWLYLAARVKESRGGRLADDSPGSLPFRTWLNYAASSYPDPSFLGGALTDAERREILDESFKHWRELSLRLRGVLALTLKRMGRPADARLVWDSVMDRARTTPDLGTSFQPEERAWLWANDTVETQAVVLRTLTELAPEDPRRDGLVQWLLLDKKLGHWKSTRATAEVIDALVHALDKAGELGVREEARVTAGGLSASFVFDPDHYTGAKNQLVVPGARLDAEKPAVVVEKETRGLLFASATWHFSTERLPREEEGAGGLFTVSRRYFKRVKGSSGVTLQPLAPVGLLSPTAPLAQTVPGQLAPGDEVEVQLTLHSRAAAEYVHLRDPRPAGLEPEGARSGFRWEGVGFYEETRDSGTNFFFERLPAGEVTLSYRVRANLAGTFRAGPATVQSMYAPEFTAYSAGETLRVEGAP